MSMTISKTITPQNDADGLAASQTPAAGGVQSLTLAGALMSGGVFTATDAGHLMVIACAADETSRTFTVTGTDIRGMAITDAITGVDTASATGVRYFKTVTGITVDDDTTGAITVGVVGKCSSDWILANWASSNFKLGFSCDIGAGTFSVQHTQADLQTNSDLNELAHNHASIAAKTADDSGSYDYPIRGIRMIFTAYTSGTGTFKVTQS